MRQQRARATITAGWICVAGTMALPPPASAQKPSPARPDPPPQGQRIEARDGDIVVIEDDARVQLVTRKQGFGRTVYDGERRWLVLVLDANSRTSPPDGKADWSYRWAGVDGEWPLGERWEGSVVVDQYRPAGTGPANMGIVVEAAGFTISLLSPKGPSPAATHVLRHKGGGASMASGLSFDAAERQMLQELARDASDPTGTVVSRSRLPPGAVTTATLTAGPAARTTPGQLPDGTPVRRVGGSIATPRKIRDVAPLYPESARAAGLAGDVMLEVTIDSGGAVASVKPISGHPILASAATDAVRQWRYEPTTVDGAAVAVVMTVRVSVR